MSTIQDLERKVQSLKDQLECAEKSLLQARIAECPVKIGDIVKEIRTKTLHRVTDIEPFCGKFWLYGNPQRKDGSFGTASRRLFDYWEPVKVDAGGAHQ